MNADELLRARAGAGQIGDRQGRGVGGENAILGDHGFDLFGHLGFDGWVFKDGFDDQITAFERIKIRRGCDAGKHFFFFLGRRFFAGDAFVHIARCIGFAFVGCGLISIDQDHFDACLSRDKRDACAHHARTEDAELFDALIRHIGGADCAFVERFFVDEERADHGGGTWVHQGVDEPACFDFERGIERHKRALVDGGQERLGGGKCALGF